MGTEQSQSWMSNAELSVLNVRLGTLHEDVGDIKLALGKLTDAVTRLALVEQALAQVSSTQERAFRAIEGHEARISGLETSMPELKKTTTWMDKAVIAAVSALFAFTMFKYGITK